MKNLLAGTKLIFLLLCILLISVINGSANGKGKGHDKDKTPPNSTDREGMSVHVAIFGDHDRQMMFDYWTKQNGGLPPGLAKRQGELPPGLEKQLRRNGHLPPGLEKKISPFPAELGRRMPPLPSDHRRVIYGSIGIILKNTNIVVDFFDMSRM